MSESAQYKVARKDLARIRSATLLPFGQGYEPPTPDEVRALLVIAGHVAGKDKLTGSEAAQLVGVNPRNVRKWTAPCDSSNHVQIPYAAWRLLLLHAGIVDLELLDPASQAADA